MRIFENLALAAAGTCFALPIVIGAYLANRKTEREAPKKVEEEALPLPRRVFSRSVGLAVPPPGAFEERQLEEDLKEWNKKKRDKKGSLIWKAKL